MVDILFILCCTFTSVVLLFWSLRHLSVRWAKTYQERFTSNAKVNLAEMFMFIEPQQLFIINIITIITGPLLIWLVIGSWTLGVIISTILAFLPRFAYRFLHARRRRKFVHQLPDGLNMIATSMQSGANLNTAIETMADEMDAPLKHEFHLFLREQRLGVEFNTAMDNMFQRIPEEEFQLVVSGMQISREVGGNLAEVLARLSDTLRRKIEMEGKINSLTAQGRLQGIVMTAMPVFITLVLYQMEPQTMGRLVSEPMGWAVIAIASLMLICGYMSIRKIVAIDV